MKKIFTLLGVLLLSLSSYGQTVKLLFTTTNTPTLTTNIIQSISTNVLSAIQPVSIASTGIAIVTNTATNGKISYTIFATGTNQSSVTNVSLAPAELFTVVTNSDGNWTGNVGTNEVRTTAQQLFIVSANVAGKDITNINNLQVTNAMAIATANVTNWYFFGSIGSGPFLALSNGIVIKTNAPGGGGSGTGSSNLTDVGYSVMVRSNLLLTNAGTALLSLGKTNVVGPTNQVEGYYGGTRYWGVTTNGLYFGDGSLLTGIVTGSGTGSSNLIDSGYSLIVRSNMIFTNTGVGTLVIGKTNAVGPTNQVEGYYGAIRYWGVTTNGLFFGDGSLLTGIGSSSSLWFTNPVAASSISNTYNSKLANLETTGSIELGNASDTTLARTGPGIVTIEGREIVTNNHGNTLIFNGDVTLALRLLANTIQATANTMNISNQAMGLALRSVSGVSTNFDFIGGALYGDGTGLSNVTASGSSGSFWYTNAAAASSVSNAYNVKIAGNLEVTGTSSYDTVNATNLPVWNAITPGTNGGASLGSSSLQFSNLFLIEGGRIHWSNTVALTESGTTLKLTGATMISSNTAFATNLVQQFWGGTVGMTLDDQFSIGSAGGASGFGRPKHLYVAEDIYGGTFNGNGVGLTNVPATNLRTNGNTTVGQVPAMQPNGTVAWTNQSGGSSTVITPGTGTTVTTNSSTSYSVNVGTATGTSAGFSRKVNQWGPGSSAMQSIYNGSVSGSGSVLLVAASATAPKSILSYTTATVDNATSYGDHSANQLPSIAGTYVWRAALTNASNVRAKIGLTELQSGSLTESSTNTIRGMAAFNADTNSANWWFITSTAGAGNFTQVNTGVALDTSFHTFKIDQTTTNYTAYIDGTAVATNSTTLYTDRMFFFYGVATKETASKGIKVAQFYGEQDW